MLGLGEVRFVPSSQPPHRPAPLASAAHRAAMTALAIAGNPAFVLDTRELARDAPSYTVDTLTALRNEWGARAPLVLLLGGDAFLNLHTWHRWRALCDFAHIVVAHRPGAIPVTEAMSAALRDLWQQHHTEDPAELRETPAGRILLKRITLLDISASEIRQTLQSGRSARYLLPDVVLDYIHTHRLYSYKETHGT